MRTDTLTEHTVVRRHPTARVRPAGDGLVALVGGQAVELTGVAQVIWKAIDGQRSAGDIATEIAMRYGIGGAEALQDVLDFLGDLARYGLVESQP